MSEQKPGFMSYRRKEAGQRPVAERRRDFRPVKLPPDEEDLCRQSARCMDCGTPFCHGYGCPLGNIVPEFNAHIGRGRWRQALELLQSTNPFPEFTGNVCPAPCEAACVLGLGDQPVTIRQIELAIVEKGFEEGYIAPRPPSRRCSKSVAVVGSGPAGLAAAQRLNRLGFRVTVYESAPRPGGMLRYGIPAFKLDKAAVDRRIDLMTAEGVRFETGVEAGRDLSCRYLQRRFDALLLTGGARRPRDLHIPGRDLAGIHFAMDFLVQQNRLLEGGDIPPAGRINAAGLDVAIIGGGDTGADCLGTALRQGARSVVQLEIMPEPPAERPAGDPWPRWPRQRRDSSSHEEGGQRLWSVATQAFRGTAGRLEEIECAEVAWQAAADGTPSPVTRAGTGFTIPAGMVLLAAGFVGPGSSRLIEELGLRRDERGFIVRDDLCRTSEEGIFAAGDISRGPSLVVHAIAEGLRAADNIAALLRGRLTSEKENRR